MGHKVPPFIARSVLASVKQRGANGAGADHVAVFLTKYLLNEWPDASAALKELVHKVGAPMRLAAVVRMVGAALDNHRIPEALAVASYLGAGDKVLSFAKDGDAGTIATALALGARAGLERLLFSAPSALLTQEANWGRVARRKVELGTVLAQKGLPVELIEAVLRWWYAGVAWKCIQK